MAAGMPCMQACKDSDAHRAHKHRNGACRVCLLCAHVYDPTKDGGGLPFE
eukprot:CAMPEP_0203934786 /NCGR_PEP_ID=MMETSP0359-20131031/72663_1 /ASSEMBLY_ACC=CAM_ASM_000338 /TAXON_ID=268821 /ORGANISM="Scrippsiella Hangoei, Strain SHTV-5" /LENGTH=49 /DNA_ID= /DNA_START= /DNA_END= /DNA_ORIENTATION=